MLHYCVLWPFGALKSLQVLIPMGALITVHAGTYMYSMMQFVLSVSWAFFFLNLICLILYTLEIQHRSCGVSPRGYAYMPLALIDFIQCCIAVILFIIAAIISIMAATWSLGSSATLVISSTFTAVFVIISALLFGIYANLIYQHLPSGQWGQLQFMIINGDSVTTHPAALFRSTTSTAPNMFSGTQS